ncbi:hypothetical protein QYE76_060937 [Lolium multiflorum]|uniref:Uncharacterized protein n=1 Tax=Lolium multiflorum TaxID=4521 RepID=A0AAD8S095_LOLMU|nr:hypothetical protein QYE76_060937 [Lolium multiflorum]
MESRPFKISHDKDRIGALLDHLLLEILERLDLRTPHEIMEAYTGTTCSLLSAKCDCKSNRAIHTLTLGFYLSAPHLSSIGQAVEDVVSLSKTRRLEFTIVPLPRPPSSRLSVAELTESDGRQFMSFSRAYPVVFRGLTRLTLQNLAFGDTDVAENISSATTPLGATVLP